MFSIYQTDAIVYGADLRRYLLVELASLLGVDRDPRRDEGAEITADITPVPFWSDTYGWNRDDAG